MTPTNTDKTNSASVIKNGSVVGFSYVLTNDQNQELDRADKAKPLFYLHGVGQIVPGLERALEGLTVGDAKKVTVEAKDGYGETNPELHMTFPRSNFPPDVEIKEGMQFFAESGQQRLMLTVLAIRDQEIDVDGNHPLSGQKLFFDIEITHVREATKEELSHGHVHGPGGHHH